MALLKKIKKKFSGESVYFDKNGKKHVAPEAKFDKWDKLRILTPVYVAMATAFADANNYIARINGYNEMAKEKAAEYINSPEVKSKFDEIYNSYGLTEEQYTTFEYMSNMPRFQPGGEYFGQIPEAFYQAKIEVTKYANEVVIQLKELIGAVPEFAINSMNTIEIGAIVGGIIIALATYASYKKDKRLKEEKKQREASKKLKEADKLK